MYGIYTETKYMNKLYDISNLVKSVVINTKRIKQIIKKITLNLIKIQNTKQKIISEIYI